jgi:DNA-binding MarR family transcriptional regulator
MASKTKNMVVEEPAASRAAAPEVTEAFLLHFFTHVHMTEAAATALGPSGFTLTKNRILGFATLTPGITVGELVRSLRVTHQNLNEPLRRLINEGYVVAKIGVEDRRHKQLFATAKGRRLYRRALAEQVNRLDHAFRTAGPEAVRGFLEVHRLLVEPADLEWIEKATRAAEANEE